MSVRSPGIYRETVSITTAADGTASPTFGPGLNGYIVGWNAESGTLTDNWDFTITSGVSDADITQGAGANQATADEFTWAATISTTILAMRIPIFQAETYTVNVTNGGATKTGTLYVYIERF